MEKKSCEIFLNIMLLMKLKGLMLLPSSTFMWTEKWRYNSHMGRSI